eukprot:gnl/TRDRNA2_/TRDRNA2_175730_c0_seq2.p1 gnl/TRDRNA2_/TRDRNA2_175730_c0~~gnl/TRDRNA2_/TRDRNA2_175730_c0_seq2.p1  ORF type:complete len:313 (+),score=22.39 gnl/TRDRNA2_/TRDRNA2_175730_c0_seq2:54-941(+)
MCFVGSIIVPALVVAFIASPLGSCARFLWFRPDVCSHYGQQARVERTLKQEIAVIGAGLGRSGTTSWECAMSILGYRVSTGSLTFMGSNLRAWINLAKDPQNKTIREVAVQQILSCRYDSTSADQPTGLFWRQLIDRFQNAKVINVRHPHGAQGFVEAVKKFDWGGCFAGVQLLTSFFIDCCNFHLPLTDAERQDVCAHEYNKIHHEIESTVPPEKLLIYNVADGWGPLCDFLQVPVPNEQFPHKYGSQPCGGENLTEEDQKRGTADLQFLQKLQDELPLDSYLNYLNTSSSTHC